MANGFVNQFIQVESISQVVVDFGVILVDDQRFFEEFNRFNRLSYFVVCVSESDEGLKIIFVLLKGFTVFNDRPIRVTPLKKEISLGNKCEWVFLVKGERLVKILCGLNKLFSLQVQDA